MYKVFVRNWWQYDPEHPGELIGCMGRKYTLRKRIKTEEEAQAFCDDWNKSHDPGPLSRMAEYEET